MRTTNMELSQADLDVIEDALKEYIGSATPTDNSEAVEHAIELLPRIVNEQVVGFIL